MKFKNHIQQLKILFFFASMLIGNSAFALNNQCLSSSELSQDRPNPTQGPTQVQTSLYILDIGNIDDHRQEFLADVVVDLQWYDPRLASEKGICRYKLADIWHPSVQIFNQRGVQEYLQHHVEVDKQGKVIYLQRYYGIFSSPLDLRRFPFDEQLLTFTLISFYNSENVKLVFNEKLTGRDEKLTISGWYIGDGSATVSDYMTQSRHAVQENEAFSSLNYSLQTRRDVNYYRWKVLLPLILIVFLSWTVFWIDPSQLGPQMGAAATAMLTLIAFLFSLRGILPPISYLTHMDYFVYGSLALVFITSIESLLTCNLAQSNKLAQAKRMDQWARWIFPSLFLTLIIMFWR